MKKKSFFFQVFTTIGTQQFGIFLTLITGIIAARFLGSEGKGYLAMLAAPVAMTTAFGELGVRQSVAFLLGKKTYTQEQIQSSVLGVFCATGVVSLIIAIFSYYSIGLLSEMPDLALLYAIITPIILLRRYAGGILLGQQRIGPINSVDLTDRLLVFSMMLGGFLLFGAYLSIAVGATVVGAMASTGLMLLFISNGGAMKPAWNREITVVILKRGITYAASLFFITSASKAGLLLVGTYASTADAGLYSVGAGISEFVRQLPLSVGFVLLARSISWKGDAASEKLLDVSVMTRVMFPLAIGFGLFLTMLALFLVPLVYGRDFSQAYVITAIQAPAEAVLAVVLLLHFFASGQGNPKLATRAFAVALAVTLLAGIGLIHSIGPLGASVAVDAGYLIGAAIYLSAFSRAFQVPIRQLIIMRPNDISFIWGKLRNNAAR